MERKRLFVSFAVLAALSLVALAILAWSVGFVWALIAAPLIVVVLGIVAQAGGILSREGPR
jgi:hypothetical protein